MKSYMYTIFGKVSARFGLFAFSTLHGISSLAPGLLKSSLIQALNKISFAMISFYKKNISPHKKGKCAHSIVYSNESCSDYVKNILLTHNTRIAIPLINKRFSACREASLHMKANSALYGNDDVGNVVIDCFSCS